MFIKRQVTFMGTRHIHVHTAADYVTITLLDTRYRYVNKAVKYVYISQLPLWAPMKLWYVLAECANLAAFVACEQMAALASDAPPPPAGPGKREYNPPPPPAAKRPNPATQKQWGRSVIHNAMAHVAGI
jgi:hypothetical protein